MSNTTTSSVSTGPPVVTVLMIKHSKLSTAEKAHAEVTNVVYVLDQLRGL